MTRNKKAVGNRRVNGFEASIPIKINFEEKIMKVLICGSRGINDPAIVSQAIKESGMCPTQIILGGARGVDRLADEYAAAHGIEFVEYLADWDRYGKRAGFLRNYVMVGAADAVIAVWNGKSAGTQHSIEYARHCGKRVFVHMHSAEPARRVAASAG